MFAADGFDDGGAEVDADIGGFVGGEDAGLGVRDFGFGDVGAVDGEPGGAALAGAAAVVGEVELECVFAGLERFGSGDAGALEPEEIVIVGGDAVLDVERPSAEAAALGEDRAVGAGFGHFDFRGDGFGFVFHVDEGGFHHALHAFGEGERGAGTHEVRPADQRAVEPLEHAVVDGQDMVFFRFGEKHRLQFLEFFRVRGGEIVGTTEVIAGIIQLPEIRFERAAWLGLPGGLVDDAGEPAVVVNRAVAGDFEVLGGAGGGLDVAETGEQAFAFDGDLRGAVDDLWLGQPGGFEDGGRDVDDVAELLALFAFRSDAFRPVGDHADAGSAEVGSDLFGPHERRVERDRPAGGHVRVGFRAAPFVDEFGHVLNCFRHAVEVGVFVEQSVHAAFGAGSVVARDVEDQGVVELAGFADGVDDAADLVVGVIEEGGEGFDLAGEERLFLGGEMVPILDGLGFGGELGAFRNDAHGDLAFQRFLTDLVPALVEFALPLGDPIGGCVVRGMDRSGSEIDEERLVRSHRLLVLHPGDGLVGHVFHEVVIRVARQLDLGDAVMEEGRPLVGLAADEAVELVEALAGGPAVEGTGNADFPGGGLVPFAEGTGAVAVEAEHFGERRDGVGDLAGGSGEPGGHFRDEAHVAGVVVAAGLECGAGGRAERGGVEPVVAQSSLGEAIEGGRRDGAAESAGRAEAEVVNQDDQHIGRAFRSGDVKALRRLGVAGVGFGDDRAFRLRDGQDRAVQRVGGEWRPEQSETSGQCGQRGVVCGEFHGNQGASSMEG